MQVPAGPSQQTTLGTSSDTSPQPVPATNYSWAATMLADINPSYATQSNIDNVVRWMYREQGNDWNTQVGSVDHNNPLNINQTGNAAGTDVFPSLTASAAATAQFLTQNSFYRGIVQTFPDNADFNTFSSAVIASPWASSHYPGGISSNLPPVLSANGTIATSPGAYGAALTAGTGSSTGTSSSSLPGTCGSKGGGINLGIGPLSAGQLGNACQIKALTGGLMIGLGGVVMITGVVLVGAYWLTGTKAGKSALSIATSGGPVGTVAKTVTRSSVGQAVARNTPAQRRIEREAQAAPARQAENEAFAARERTRRTIDVPTPGMRSSTRSQRERATMRSGNEPF